MRAGMRIAVAALVLVAGSALLQLVSRGEAVPLRRSFEELPRALGAYRGADEGLEPDVLEMLGVTDFVMRRYTADGRPPVWLYAGYYASQRTGVIIHSPRQCLPGNGWTIVKSERVAVDVPTPAGRGIDVNRVLVSRGEDRQMVLYWYQERGRIVANEYWGKAYLVWDSMTRSRTDGALVRLSAPVVASEDVTYRQLVAFTTDVFPLLTEFLPE
jgi:EpsI family protein